MNDLQFKSLLQLYTPCIIKEIAARKNMDEETKLWHFSPVLLVDLLEQELETGEIEYPVEG